MPICWPSSPLVLQSIATTEHLPAVAFTYCTAVRKVGVQRASHNTSYALFWYDCTRPGVEFGSLYFFWLPPISSVCAPNLNCTPSSQDSSLELTDWSARLRIAV